MNIFPFLIVVRELLHIFMLECLISGQPFCGVELQEFLKEVKSLWCCLWEECLESSIFLQNDRTYNIRGQRTVHAEYVKRFWTAKQFKYPLYLV